MAVDTPRKRRAALTIGTVFLAPMVLPDGTIGAEDRAVVAYSYYYAAESPVADVAVLEYAAAYPVRSYTAARRVVSYTKARKPPNVV